MSERNQGTEFLSQRYPRLANSPEVDAAAKRMGVRTRTKLSRDPNIRIQNYLDRFKELVERPDPTEKSQGITALKKVLIGRHVVRVEDIPDSYWAAQLRVMRNRGESGDWWDLPEEEILKLKQEHLAQSKEDQQGSIEEWIDYLASDSSSYLPDHLKYWAFAGMLRLERYEKAEKDKQGNVVKPGRFPERPTGRQRSIKMFPEVNENGLKFIASAYKQQVEGKPIYWGYNQDIPAPARQSFQDALSKKDFREAYGWVQEYIPPITDQEMQITGGENCGWVTFSKEIGNTGQDVASTLAGKGTGWCIAGKETAQGNYLDQGAKLHIYYTRNKDNKQVNPRVVIVELGGKVIEVRGIEWEENVDDYMKATEVIGSKLKQLPGGEAFFATDADTKYLTVIDKKMASGTPLTGAELTFLWEIDRPIQYFGIKKDPRIQELKVTRNLEEDMLVVFGCEQVQIARSIEEFNSKLAEGVAVKAYVGKIAENDSEGNLLPQYKDIFQKLKDIEHIYTTFPEGKIMRQQVAVGGKTRKQLFRELQQNGFRVSRRAEDVMKSPDFTTLPVAQMLDIVLTKVGDLGFPDMSSIRKIWGRAQELGLYPCIPEVGPQMRLQTKDQPQTNFSFVADLFGVFILDRHGGRSQLDATQTGFDSVWSPTPQFVFSLSNPAAQASQETGKIGFLRNLRSFFRR